MSSSVLDSATSGSNYQLSPLFHYGPVTFIKLYKRYIFVGYGPILFIYQLSLHNEDIELVFQHQIFKRNKIHHISVNSQAGKIIVSGGRSFTVLPIDVLQGTQAKEVALKERAINEWIITSAILDDGTILLLNSYNVVYKINQDGGVVEKIHCGEKSILYSGSINVLSQGANKGQIYIAAGTVMNGIIIWDLTQREIIHSLQNHEGSIFGVKIDSSGDYIVSCSDDRSIKLYDFGTGDVLATGWGHGSRIWNLEFTRGGAGGNNDEELQIMSIGEDCTLRIWKHDPSSDLLQLVKVIENCHRGKHVWSGDVDASNLQLCCTGGADGRVRLHDLKRENQVTTKLTMSDFEPQLASKASSPLFGKKDCVRDYFELIHLNKLVCLTSNGYLIEYDYVSKKCHVVHHDEKLAGVGIVDGFDDLNLVVVADRGGNLLTVQYGKDEHKVSTIESDNTSMKITNLLTSSMEGRYFVLIESPNVKIPFKLHEISTSGPQVCQFVHTWDIPKPESNFPITAMTIDTANNWIIFASKRVSLYLVDLNDFSRCLTLKKIAMGDTVSSISILNSQSGVVNMLVLARDGMYLIVTITQVGGQFQFDIIHENKLTRGFIEGGFFQGEDLILYGFKSSYFYIWNENKQIEIMNEYCGGNGHRHFKFCQKSLKEFSFIYLFKNDVYVCHYNGRFIKERSHTNSDALSNFGLIHDGTHGREIRGVAIQNGQLLPDGSRLLISSAEDSTIGLSKLLPNGTVHNYWNMTNHISGMQAVGFLNRDYAFSCAANEEFIIWKLNWLHQSTGLAIPTLKELARLKSDQDVPDLRVMDYDAVEYDECIHVVTAYSNSMIKLWKFDKGARPAKLELIQEWNYSTCCILHAQFFNFDNESRRYLLIATTDGNVTVYDVSNPTNPAQQCQLRLHQSGVKAICLVKNNGNNVYLLTGGDDNALVASIITSTDDGLDIQVVGSELNAASATITSISHVRDDMFVAVSVDQMIRLWSVSDGLVCRDARYTTVADTGCCDVTEVGGKHVVVVGGAGLSTWEISKRD